jgi:hypothetical protein
MLSSRTWGHSITGSVPHASSIATSTISHASSECQSSAGTLLSVPALWQIRC